ncbi:MAG: lipopolysaccharide export system permease protein [Abditibacteriota bacterium]|nr:lipopolysaccharide export system permease protein [Abditibacteriota bacterium]
MKDIVPPIDELQAGKRLATPRNDRSASRALRPSLVSRLPGKIADRYLFTLVVEATFRGLGMFMMLLLFFAVITATQKLLQQELTMMGALEFTAYQLPRILLFTLPMSVLYGIVQVFSELSGKGEIIAMWAGGMSLQRMLRAPLVWGSVLAIMAFWVQESIVPQAERAKNEVIARQMNQMTAVIHDIEIPDEMADGSSRVISAESFDPKRKILVKPVVHEFDSDREFVREISAARASWDLKSGQWIFYDGQYFTKASEQQAKDFTLANGRFKSLEVTAPPPQKFGKKALSRIESLKKGNFEMVSISDLRTWRSGLKHGTIEVAPKDRPRFISGATFGIHDKIATPLICLAVILVGAPLGIRPQRSGGGVSMGLSLVVLLLYYVVWTWASKVGKAGVMNPYLLAYLPFGLTFVIGLFLVAKKSR